MNIVAFYVYLKLDAKFTRWTMMFTAILSVEFMIRNTAPIGWVPLLFIKVFRDGTFMSFLMSAILVAAPILAATVYFDSYIYSMETGKFEWTITGYNFLRVNVVEGLSKYFGDDPWWAYVGKFFWAQYNVMYPLIIYAVYYYTRESWKQKKSPEMSYMCIFYIIIFSIIPHKEKRFMLPITAFIYLILGYLLVRKIKAWGRGVRLIIYLGIFAELGVHLFYHIHHKLWVFTDYMLAQGGSDYHPHSFFTSKRYDQPWHTNLHHPDINRRTRVYTANSDPDFFLKKHKYNLIMAYDLSSLVCIDLLQNIEDGVMRPEYLMIEEQALADSIYGFQACEYAILNLGKELAKSKDGSVPNMYYKDVTYRTQYAFNFTTMAPFMKPTHLYRLNM